MAKTNRAANDKRAKSEEGGKKIMHRRFAAPKMTKLPLLRIVLYMITGILVGGVIGIIVIVPGEGDGLIVGISILGAVVGVLVSGAYTIAMEYFKWE